MCLRLISISSPPIKSPSPPSIPGAACAVHCFGPRGRASCPSARHVSRNRRPKSGSPIRSLHRIAVRCRINRDWTGRDNMATPIIYGTDMSTYVRTTRMVFEEKPAQYELVDVSVVKREVREPAHLARNPFGTVPAFELDGF